MKIKDLKRKQIKDICKKHHGYCEKLKCPLWTHKEKTWEELCQDKYNYVWCPKILLDALENGLINQEEYEKYAATLRDIEIKL